MFTPIASRMRAALAAARNPDRPDSPEPTPAGEAVTDPAALAYRHGNIGVGPDGTWAWFRCDAVDYWGRPIAAQDGIVLAQGARLAELAQLGIPRVILRGTRSPHPTKSYLDATAAASPDRLATPSEWLDREQRIHGYFRTEGASRPVTFLAVPLTFRKLEREHLPMLLQSDRCADHLSVVEDARVLLGHITQTLSRPGYTARPATAAEFGWLLDRSHAVGLPEPERGDAGPVEFDVDWYTDRLGVNRADDTRTERGWTQILHVHAPEPERDTAELTPMLGWLANARITYTDPLTGHTSDPTHLEWAACVDLKIGAAAVKELEFRERVNDNLAQGEKYGRRWRERIRVRSAAAVDEAKHSTTPSLAVQTPHVILVSVSTPYGGRYDVPADPTGARIEPAVLAVKSAFTQAQHATLERRSGQYGDYRLFAPGEPWPRLDAVGDVIHGTGCSFGAAVPNMDMSIGDPVAFPLGRVRGSREVGTFDPWGGVAGNTANMFAILGEPRVGKTAFIEALTEYVVQGGRRVSITSGDPIIGGLTRLPSLARHAVEVPLGKTSPDGIIAAGFLIPERPRHAEDTDEEHERLLAADRVDRRGLTVQHVVECLDPTLVSLPEVRQLITDVVADVAGEYGVHPQDVIDAFAREARTAGGLRSERAGSIARGLRSASRLAWPTRDVTDATFASLVGDAPLRVVTTPDLAHPPAGKPRTDWTEDERLALLITGAATWFGARDLFTDREPKMHVTDEANTVTHGASSYGAFLTRLSTNSGKYGVAAGAAFHTMTALREASPDLASLFGAALVFRTLGDNARNALELLHLPAGAGWEEKIARQLPGEVTYRDWSRERRIRRLRISQLWWGKELRELAYTTPVERPPALTTTGGIAW